MADGFYSTPWAGPARRVLVRAVWSTLAWGAGAGHGLAADEYPIKPIRLVVPYAPAGFSDIVARSIAPKLQKTLGQPVVIENRGGANGIVGTTVVAQAPADGYTLLLALDSHASNQSLYKKLPYDGVKDFAPIIFLGTAPMVMIGNDTYEDLTVESFEHIVESFRAGNGKSVTPGPQIKRQFSAAEGGATTLLEQPTAQRTYKPFPPPPPTDCARMPSESPKTVEIFPAFVTCTAPAEPPPPPVPPTATPTPTTPPIETDPAKPPLPPSPPIDCARMP